MPDPDDIFPTGRRDFFSEALREAIDPLSKILERKIRPVLRVLEDIPAQIDAAAATAPRDQPHLQPAPADAPIRRVSLPLAPDRILRPPGALPPGEFENVCTACGDCVQACPSNAIKLDRDGFLADGLPYIAPQDRPCVVCDELACMKHCPPGALKLVDKLQIRMGTAKVDHALCRRTAGDDCHLCVDACPVKEQAIYVSAHTGKVRIRKNACLGCGLCEYVCPTDTRAVTVQAPNPPRDEIIVA